MESRRQGRCATRGKKRRAFSGMVTSPYSPSFIDLRRLLALVAAAEDVEDMVVVMVEA